MKHDKEYLNAERERLSDDSDMSEEDEIELRSIAASAVNSLLPQAATQQACIAYADYKCAPLLKRIAELEAALHLILEDCDIPGEWPANVAAGSLRES